jgi:hypothetical protein
MTSGPLAKAQFGRLKKGGGGDGAGKGKRRLDPDGEPQDVQLNPTSLRLARSNNTNKQDPATAKGQTVDHPSVGRATLSFDLEFDTADEGTTLAPVSVLSKTQIVRQFVEPPKGLSASDAAPPAQFQWGRFIFQGVVTSVSEDIDYFASDGTPLRAKVSVTMDELNLDFENATDARGVAARAAASISLNAGVSVSGSAGLNVAGGGFSVSGNASVAGRLDGGIAAQGSTSFGANASGSFDTSGSASGRASGSADVSGSVGGTLSGTASGSARLTGSGSVSGQADGSLNWT